MLRMFDTFERVDSCARVFPFEPAIGGDRAFAVAVGARIHHHDGVAVLEKQFRLADDADAVIGDSVEQQNPGAIRFFRANLPAA